MNEKLLKIKTFLYRVVKEFNIVEQSSPATDKARQYLKNIIMEKFLDQSIGKEYNVDLTDKKELLEKFEMIPTKVQTATNWIYYVLMATKIFAIPKKTKGDIIECGAWKGGSSAILSLICQKVGRKLIAADSFQGIPEDDDKHGHFYAHLNVLGYYRKGMYDGTLSEVKKNIREYGYIKSCEFVKGFYDQSLKKLKKPLVFAFLDVDLRVSLQDSVKYIWPLLVEGSYIYTDDSCDMDVVKLWFDENWWKKNLNQKAPGYVGSGCGLPINPDFSSLGYIRKISDPEKMFKRENWFDAKIED